MNDKDEVPLIESSRVSNTGVGRVEQVLRYIEAKYVDSVDIDLLIEQAITTVLDDLDPHSTYIHRDRMAVVDEEMSGKYVGLGVETITINDTTHIRTVYPNTPAERSGLAVFDRILSLGERSIVGDSIPFDTVRAIVRRSANDPLDVQYLRPGSNTMARANVLVEQLPNNPISIHRMADSLCAYIKIDRFSDNTYVDFMAALEDLIRQDTARHLIIDLRGNPGGLLPEATNILSQLFIEKGKLLVYTRDKNGRENKYKTTGKPFFPIDRIAVLIDENSASASEIIAGAIQDLDRGVVIGRRSFGKGLVQDQYRLSDQSAIRLTTARYYTPSGRSIQRSYKEGEYGYSDPLNTRWSSQELFVADSMPANPELLFETDRYRRPIYGGGGITPDIFVPLDSLHMYNSYQQISNAAAYFAYTYADEHRSSLPNDAEAFLTDWQVNKAMWSRFKDYLLAEGYELVPSTFEDRRAEHEAQLKYQLGLLLFGSDANALLLEDDPYIDAALDYLHSTIELTELN